jgi:cytochrome b subunit of formate dehydrogenase
MKLLFWISGVLVVLLAVPSAFFFALHLSTGEPVPLVRARALYRWTVVVVLGTFNIVIFGRVIEGIRALL